MTRDEVQTFYNYPIPLPMEYNWWVADMITGIKAER